MLIAFEGPDGTGKTSICEQLKRVINAQGADNDCAEIHSPYYNETGLFINSLLKNNKLRKITSMFLYLAYFAEAKAQIENAIATNKYVLLDRYFLSTYIYNCGVQNELEIPIGTDISSEINNHISKVNDGLSVFLLYLASVVERASVDHLLLLKGHAEYAFELTTKNMSGDQYQESFSRISNLINLLKINPKHNSTPAMIKGELLNKKILAANIVFGVIDLPRPHITIVFNTPIKPQDDNGIDKEEFSKICDFYKSSDILDQVLGKHQYIVHSNAKTLVEHVKHFPSEKSDVLHNIA